MNKYHTIICLFIFIANHTYSYSQDFLQKNKKQTIRAYSVPIGTTNPSSIIGDNSKTYKIITPKFNKAIRLSIFQSDYKEAQNKITDHLLYQKDYQQGESMFFSVVINEIKNNYFIFVPGSFMGKLNFSCNKNELIKHIQVETGSNSSFIFYIDSKENNIETKIKKYKQDSKISNDSDLNQVLSLLRKFYIIHYKYE